MSKDKVRELCLRKLFGDSDLVYLLILIRKFLEINKLKSKFSILNLYCNLLVHALIDKSATADGIFYSLNECLFPWMSKRYADIKAADMPVLFRKSLQVDVFIKEFKSVLREFGVRFPFKSEEDFLRTYIGVILNHEVSARGNVKLASKLESLAPRSFIPHVGAPEEKIYIHTFKFTTDDCLYAGEPYLECYGLSTRQAVFKVKFAF